MKIAIDRRSVLIGGGAAAGLVVAFAMWPREYGSGLDAPHEGAVFDHYLTIAPDGRVTVAVPQVETGQGVWTALPQILADELGADWNRVAVIPAPSAKVYGNRLIEAQVPGVAQGLLRVTAGSTSIRAFEAPLRHAGAIARMMLCAAAAAQWHVAAGECDTEGGFVVHEGKRRSFGALAAAAAGLRVPERPVLRVAGAGRIAGKSLPRLDLPPKTDGSFRFAADVRVPGMVFAALSLVPRGGSLASHQPVKGAQIIAEQGWIAAIARTGWDANRALEAAAPRFTAPAGADGAAIDRALHRAFRDGPMTAVVARGDYAKAVAGSRPLAAVYSSAPTPHLTLELPCVAARLSGDRLEVWAGTLAPEAARIAAADGGETAIGETTLYPMPLGDQSGGATDLELVRAAAALTRRLGKPVSVSLSREQARRNDRPAPPMLARMTALPNGAGGVAAWGARVAGSDGLTAALARLTGKAPRDALAGFDPPYGFPAVAIDHARTSLPIGVGAIRGGGETFGAFATESFVDELARAMGVEPLAFRIAMLGGNLRMARALTAAAALAGWDGGGPGSNMGLAGIAAFGSFIAVVATASVGPGGAIAVSRIVAAVDCGRVVNPGLVRQQVEGGLIAGLAQATAAAPTIRYGQIVATPPAMPRLANTPKIEVELLANAAPSGGVSGLGFAVIAPAIANALAAGTGRRLRKLPLDPMGA